MEHSDSCDDVSDRRQMREETQYASGDHSKSQKSAGSKERYKDKDDGRGKRDNVSRGPRFDDRSKHGDRDRGGGSGRDRGGDSRREKDQPRDGGRYGSGGACDKDRRSDKGDRDRHVSKTPPASKSSRYADDDKRGGRDEADKKRRSEGQIQQQQRPKENEKDDAKKKEQKEELSEEDKMRMEEEEKQRQEEERLRQEEERQRLEEEAKIKAIEEAERLKAEEEKSLKDYIAECKARIEEKDLARAKNLEASDKWADEGFFCKLDSSLKKNTAFVKKIKNLTESQKDSLCKELMGLNLTKYIGEVASALVEAKLKMSDVPCAIHICGVLHERYSEFSASLLEVFNKSLLGKKDEKISNPSKYRVDLRFLGELVAAGVFKSKEGLPILANQLSILVSTDREEHCYLSILTSFCKHCGDEYMGIVPRKYRLLSEKFGLEIPRSGLLRQDRQKACRNLLKDYYTSLVKHLTKDHKSLKQMEAHNRKTMQTKGEVSTERRELYEMTFTAFQKLHTSTLILADLLDEDMPDFPQEEYRDEESGMLDIYNPLKDAEFQYEGDKTLFEDEDTRTFYEHLPDLRAFIPGILYRDSEQSSGKDDMKNADTGLEEEMENLAVDDIEKELETEQIEESMREAQRQEGGGEEEKEEERFVLPEVDEEDQDIGSLMKVQFESFISSLNTCVNRDLIDKAATEFCMNFNTKTNRKKLVKTLFSVHRTRYDLLPFYSRLVAILEPCMPELATDLVQLLKSDFKWLVRKKDQINIETKLKITRFIGELVKFKVCPKTEALQCLKILMFDFRHHNIEMACALLETCGRFLYRSSDSHYRTKIYLEVMMRKKTATRLDTRYDTMIENAFYYSNPPEVQVVARKERPPMHQYIRKLLYKDLSKATTEKVLRQMRKLPWDDTEIAFYATKCLTAVWNIRYNSIHCAANLLAGIGPYHEHIAIQVVDGVLEDIRLGMEVNHPRYNQRRVSCVKYLAELYNYRMFESSVIFKVLYSLITFGVSFDENNPSPLDRPEHLFRIRLVCVTLETCGQFFDEGLSKKRLDCFLVYFQRYYWFKKKSSVFNDQRPFPIDIDNFVHETIDFVRPKLKMAESHEEACKACEVLEAEYRSKIANVLTIIETEGTEEEEEDTEEEGLSTILEGEENEDDLTLSGGVLEESGTQDSDGSISDEDLGDGEGEEEEEGESCTDDYSGSDEEDGDEKEVKVLKPKHVTSKEDEDFMASLDQMMNENIKARTQEPLKVPAINISLPQQIKAKGKKPVGLLTGPIPDKAEEDNSGLHFVLMTRKGNKQQLTDLEIPMSAEFATKFKEREEANRLEKEKMKQMVLTLNERQEEEELQEALATLTGPTTSNANRERKVKYQHPKGAPDADLIFGNKKR